MAANYTLPYDTIPYLIGQATWYLQRQELGYDVVQPLSVPPTGPGSASYPL